MSVIRVLREAQGISRSELARRAQMDASDVGKIERGIMQPYPGQILKLAKALGARATEIANDTRSNGS